MLLERGAGLLDSMWDLIDGFFQVGPPANAAAAGPNTDISFKGLHQNHA